MRAWSNEVRYGLILSAASFLWVCLEYAIGLHDRHLALHPVVTNLFAVIPIGVLVRVLMLRRARDGGALTWRRGIASGMLVSAITAVFGAPSMWLFFRYVNPGYFSTMIAEAVRTGHDRAAAEGYFNLANYALSASVMPLVMGLITTLAITAVLKRRRAFSLAPHGA
ncbi:MAG: DUF4199 domain-containing protein [Myxococcales bacterium]|nr:DUF4199 domain-containing protein [Myxococcales bacterium]